MSSPSFDADIDATHHLDATQDDHDESGKDAVTPEEKGIAAQRVSCDRCRRRKIKCNRVEPCNNCTKSETQCTYNHGQRTRPKRQRLVVSSLYESRMEYIHNKVNDLTEMVTRLSQADRDAAAGKDLKTHAEKKKASHSLSARSTTQISEHDGIETSLFSQAVFAVKVLNAAIENDPDSKTATEMSEVLGALQEAVTTQNQRNESQDRSPPFSTSLQHGETLADLPHPPLDRIFACLAMAQDRQRIRIPWLFELRSVGTFTEYVVKVCSPGPKTDAELIIVYAGLYWLFSECSAAASSEAVRQDYLDLECMCRGNLETVLSQLPFHMPTTIDSVYALYLASMYCLQSRKPPLSWMFISRASLMAQALRLHNGFSMAQDSVHEKQWKICLFWAVHDVEKPSSLRAGVSSTIRDQEITVPRIQPAKSGDRLLPTNIPGYANISSIYGRVYDELYSPGAAMLPASVRVSRAKTLADELEPLTKAQMQCYDGPSSTSQTLHNLAMPRLLGYMLKTSNLSLLASILRSIPSDTPPTSAPSPECLSVAREALEQHQSCLLMLKDYTFHSATIDIWLNGGLIMSPFIPFTIIFCNIVERNDPSDLECLGQFASVFQSVSELPRFALHVKQARIFKLLYDVAAKYIAVRLKPYDGDAQSAAMAAFDFGAYSTSYFSNDVCMDLPSLSSFPAWNVEANQSRIESQLSQADLSPFMDAERQDGSEGTIVDTGGFQTTMDGAHLSDWFYQSHQMMNLGDV